MGVCCSQSFLHKEVLFLSNQHPQGWQYTFYQSHSVRYSDIIVNRNSTHNNNQYKFTMNIDHDQSISIVIRIINQKIQRSLTENYQLKIQKRMIIDIFDKKISSTLVEAKNKDKGTQFSIKLFSFRGYTSYTFKKQIYSLHIIAKRLPQIDIHSYYYHKLTDYYVYGCNPDKQVLNFLYQKSLTSLANVAEYRMHANWPWTTQEKIKIFIDIFEAVYLLHQNKITHRDLRPSNIFFIQRLGKYVIGNFHKSLQTTENIDQQMERTVYGLPYTFSHCYNKKQLKKLANHIIEQRQYAPYLPQYSDYHGLTMILKLLETLDISKQEVVFKDKNLLEINKQLELIYDSKQQYSHRYELYKFQGIRKNIKKVTSKQDFAHLKLNEDKQIGLIVSRLLYSTHKSIYEQFIFQIYDALGYEKQYADTSHLLIQRNNEKGKHLQNAYLLKNLAEFSQRSGTKGTQYYCNACSLFLKRTQRQLNLGNLHLAQEDYYQAQKTFIKFSQHFQSPSFYIQLHRIHALIKMYESDQKHAIQIIKSTVEYAAKNKISIQKQMTLLLTYSIIHLKGNEAQRKSGEESLKNGLAICEKQSAFQSISSSNIHKSNFLYQKGKLFFQKLKFKSFEIYQQTIKQSKLSQNNNLNRNDKNKQAELISLKNSAEQMLNLSLQLKQQQKIDLWILVVSLKTLAEFYFQVQQYNDAKRCIERCQILLKQFEKQANLMIIIRIYYVHGCILYGLRQYQNAQKKFKKSSHLFTDIIESTYDVLKFNVLGNLGLTQMKLKKLDGQKNVDEALIKLKSIKGQNFYDYIFLMKKSKQIKLETKANKKQLPK